MKKFYECSKMPIIVGITAALLYCVDSLIGPCISTGASFMWISFIAWTITVGMKIKEMLIIWLGIPLGFGFAVFMIYFSQSFDAKLLSISIAGVLGTLVANLIMMYFGNFKDIWGKLLTGIFLGVALTFLGIGISLTPNTFSNASILLGTILLYCILGMFCAFITSYLHSIWKTKNNILDNKFSIYTSNSNQISEKNQKESSTNKK